MWRSKSALEEAGEREASNIQKKLHPAASSTPLGVADSERRDVQGSGDQDAGGEVVAVFTQRCDDAIAADADAWSRSSSSSSSSASSLDALLLSQGRYERRLSHHGGMWTEEEEMVAAMRWQVAAMRRLQSN
jgi:hypothetical protein